MNNFNEFKELTNENYTNMETMYREQILSLNEKVDAATLTQRNIQVEFQQMQSKFVDFKAGRKDLNDKMLDFGT